MGRAFRARDRATGRVVLTATDCTKQEFVDELIRRYGDDWVNGSVEHASRLLVEEFEEAKA